ncbi:MAG: chemotaxis protein CheX [Methanoregula sp.]|jgi:chemotaxis protein CheC|nr:chemotaxis protein CheX [Methanoregula sp.]MDD5023721.1 chemotaxis protein CheX [Methanoregula sp.]MDD5187990.1 chemotaxis protein CheX [Methanoregula sp.]
MKTIDTDTLDAIRELVNIGVGKAAGQLNQMTGSPIRLQIPTITLVPFADILSAEKSILPGDVLSAVTLDFNGTLSGITAVVFPPESAILLVMVLTGEKEESPDLDAMRVEALKEVGNIIINGVMGSIANVLGERLTYSIPCYTEGSFASIAERRSTTAADEWVILARTNFLIEALHIEGDILLILEVGSLDHLVESILRTGNREGAG